MKNLTACLLLCTIAFSRAEPVRVACVGDSITAGTVLKDRERTSYPSLLAGLLGGGYEVRNFGHSGATVTSSGQGALPFVAQPEHAAALAWDPGIVVVMLGTNDTKTAVFDAGVTTFRERYQELLDAFLSLPVPPRILICLPVPVMGGGRYTINEPNRQKLLPIIAALAQKNHAELIDLDPVLGGKPEMFRDLVHPNEEATAAIARAVAERIQQKTPHEK